MFVPNWTACVSDTASSKTFSEVVNENVMSLLETRHLVLQHFLP